MAYDPRRAGFGMGMYYMPAFASFAPLHEAMDVLDSHLGLDTWLATHEADGRPGRLWMCSGTSRLGIRRLSDGRTRWLTSDYHYEADLFRDLCTGGALLVDDMTLGPLGYVGGVGELRELGVAIPSFASASELRMKLALQGRGPAGERT